MLNVGGMPTASERWHGALAVNVAVNVNSSAIFFWKESAAWNVNGFADLLCHLLPGISFRKHVLPPPPVHAVKLPPLPSVHPFFWPLSWLLLALEWQLQSLQWRVLPAFELPHVCLLLPCAPSLH